MRFGITSASLSVVNLRWVVFSSIVLISCSRNDTRLLGIWQTNSDFYQARYRIHLNNDSIKGEVIYYNDGTTVITEADSPKKYVFTYLKKEKDTFVDASSGATKTENPQMWSIRIKSDDTLLIGQQIGKQMRTEIWTRIKE